MRIDHPILDDLKAKAPDAIIQYVRSLNSESNRTEPPRGGGILFMPTNGAGMGHLVRTLAVARRVRKSDPQKEIVFLSTCPAMNLISKEGFEGYYVPTRSLLPDSFTVKNWNELIKEQLYALLHAYKPGIFVFDGAFPYSGVVQSMNSLPGLKKVWINRGGARAEADAKSRAKAAFFNCVIRPGEAGAGAAPPDGYIRFEPIVYMERSELLDREKVLAQFKIPGGSKVVYVQLGAGNINNIKASINVICRLLEKRKDMFVFFGESFIGDRLDVRSPRTIIVRDFPASKYFNAFDAAICACGYNTFHELLHFGVPSIFVPNTSTLKDDQFSRAMNAVTKGAGLLWDGVTEATLETYMDVVFSIKNIYSDNSKALVKNNGANEAARFLLGL